jgi:hypothetical protein
MLSVIFVVFVCVWNNIFCVGSHCFVFPYMIFLSYSLRRLKRSDPTTYLGKLIHIQNLSLPQSLPAVMSLEIILCLRFVTSRSRWSTSISLRAQCLWSRLDTFRLPWEQERPKSCWYSKIQFVQQLNDTSQWWGLFIVASVANVAESL